MVAVYSNVCLEIKNYTCGAPCGAPLVRSLEMEARQRPQPPAPAGAARHTQEPTRAAVAAAKVLNFTVQLYGGVYYCADRCTLHVQLFRESRTDPSTERRGYARAYKCIQL